MIYGVYLQVDLQDCYHDCIHLEASVHQWFLTCKSLRCIMNPRHSSHSKWNLSALQLSTRTVFLKLQLRLSSCGNVLKCSEG